MRIVVAATAIAVILTQPVFASAEPISVETTAAAPETVKFFDAYFGAKSRHDVQATMTYFSPGLLTYTDAVLGWTLDNFDSVKDVFAEAMPKWGNGKSYPFRIIGGPDSAVVAFIDTPELFGGEIRLLGAVDFKSGKIVRWVDYWDSTGFPTDVYNKLRTPQNIFPTDFKDEGLEDNAAPEIVSAVTKFHTPLSLGTVNDIAKTLSYDVVYEDFALRAQILGRDAVVRYLSRISQIAPFAKNSSLLHVVGGKRGGGFEWRGGTIRGITAIELNASGQIIRITNSYDGRLLPSDVHRELVSLSAE